MFVEAEICIISRLIYFVSFMCIGPSDYPQFQASQAVMIPPGPSMDITVNFTITDDSILECNETFTLSLVSLDTVRLQINPGRGQANVTIIDDDSRFYIFTIYFIKVI